MNGLLWEENWKKEDFVGKEVVNKEKKKYKTENRKKKTGKRQERNWKANWKTVQNGFWKPLEEDVDFS